VNWSRLPVVIAALSLLVALAFNSAQVRNAAVSQDDARLATELGLLTQLQSVMSNSVYARVQYAPQFRQLRGGQRDQLTSPAYRATVEEAANMDYLAWLFNNGYLTSDGADHLWGPRMICEYKKAFAPGLSTPAQDLPELVRFIRERGPELSTLGQGC
jgi:hypothetical protein